MGYVSIPLYLALLPSFMYMIWKCVIELFYMCLAVLIAFLVALLLSVLLNHEIPTKTYSALYPVSCMVDTRYAVCR